MALGHQRKYSGLMHGFIITAILSGRILSILMKRKKGVERLVDRHFCISIGKKLPLTHRLLHLTVSHSCGHDHNYTGVPPDEYNTFRNGLTWKLEAVRDPNTGERIINRIFNKRRGISGTHNRRSPDLDLSDEI